MLRCSFFLNYSPPPTLNTLLSLQDLFADQGENLRPGSESLNPNYEATRELPKFQYFEKNV